MPSPLIGLPESVVVTAAGAVESGAEQAESKTAMQVNSVEISARGENMAFHVALTCASGDEAREWYQEHYPRYPED